MYVSVRVLCLFYITASEKFQKCLKTLCHTTKSIPRSSRGLVKWFHGLDGWIKPGTMTCCAA